MDEVPLQDRQVPLELVGGDVGLVGVPFLTLVAQEELQHMVPEGLPEHVGALREEPDAEDRRADGSVDGAGACCAYDRTAPSNSRSIAASRASRSCPSPLA